MAHKGGIVNVYKNTTENMIFEEELEFTTDGMVLAGDPNSNTLQISLNPGESQHYHLLATKFQP